MEKKLNESEIFKMQEHDTQLVKGRFNYKENPGGKFKFSMKLGKKFPLFREAMIDGREYTIPLGAAKYINSHCRYPRLVNATDDKGREIPGTSVEIQVQRAEFSIYEFITPEMTVPKDLVKIVKMSPVTPMNAN